MNESLLLLCYVSSSHLLSLVERHAHRLIFSSSVLSGSLIAGFIIYWAIFHFALRRSVSPMHHRSLRRFRKPIFWTLVVCAVMVAVPTFGISAHNEEITE
ncbi:MAG: hypothetical protein ACRD28_00270, partial [Acidobacteriaceae bacterium]